MNKRLDSAQTDAVKPATRRRGRGRSLRTARKQPNQHLQVPWIRRNIPPYDLLDEENLEAIEQGADEILAEIGIEFREDPETVRLFREAGAEVTRLNADSWNLRFQPGMIREILRTAPRRFTQHARNPANTGLKAIYHPFPL